MSDQTETTGLNQGPLRVIEETGSYLNLGPDKFEIRGGHLPVCYVDLITEHRHTNGVVCLAFGALTFDGGNSGHVDMTARLRMNLAVAQNLHNVLGEIIKDATKAPDKSVVN